MTLILTCVFILTFILPAYAATITNLNTVWQINEYSSRATAVLNNGTVLGIGGPIGVAYKGTTAVMRAEGVACGEIKPHALTTNGLIAGTGDEENRDSAFVWQAGVFTCLPPPANSFGCSGTGVTIYRQVVGYCSIEHSGNIVQNAFMWRKDWVTTIPLGTLGGPESEAHGVNRDRVVVGWASTSDGHRHPFIWREPTMTDLGTLGGLTGEARAINSKSQVTGWAENAGGHRNAFFFDGRLMNNLQTLGGTQSMGHGVADNGTVVGESKDAGGVTRAFVRRVGKPMTALPGLTPNSESRATGISPNGKIIVGEAMDAGGVMRAVSWR